MKILIVTGDFYEATDLEKELRIILGDDVVIESCFRDYHADASVEDADVILGDGTCKASAGDGTSIWIRFSARKLAVKYGKPYIPMKLFRISVPARILAKHIRRYTQETATIPDR